MCGAFDDFYSSVDVIRVEVFHFDLGDFFELGVGDLAHFGFVRFTRTRPATRPTRMRFLTPSPANSSLAAM